MAAVSSTTTARKGKAGARSNCRPLMKLPNSSPNACTVNKMLIWLMLERVFSARPGRVGPSEAKARPRAMKEM